MIEKKAPDRGNTSLPRPLFSPGQGTVTSFIRESKWQKLSPASCLSSGLACLIHSGLLSPEQETSWEARGCPGWPLTGSVSHEIQGWSVSRPFGKVLFSCHLSKRKVMFCSSSFTFSSIQRETKECYFPTTSKLNKRTLGVGQHLLSQFSAWVCSWSPCSQEDGQRNTCSWRRSSSLSLSLLPSRRDLLREGSGQFSGGYQRFRELGLNPARTWDLCCSLRTLPDSRNRRSWGWVGSKPFLNLKANARVGSSRNWGNEDSQPSPGSSVGFASQDGAQVTSFYSWHM